MLHGTVSLAYVHSDSHTDGHSIANGDLNRFAHADTCTNFDIHPYAYARG